MLTFHNPGLLDLRLLTTFGASIKPATDTPIGYFGTGLKYALAVALRGGATIRLTLYQSRANIQSYSFDTVIESIRGTKLNRIFMNRLMSTTENFSSPLPFTTDLGKNWTPWMVYRELWANARDEGGTVSKNIPPFITYPSTHITIQWPELERLDPNQFILTTKPIHTANGLELHPAGHKSIFYRGIKVAELVNPSAYTYNLTDPVQLTEDRTLSSYDAETIIAGAMSTKLPMDIALKIVAAPEDSYEHTRLKWYNYHLNHESTLVKAAIQASRNPANLLNPTLETYIKQTLINNIQTFDLTPTEQSMLDRAKNACQVLGHPIDDSIPIIFAKSLGEAVLGKYANNKIYLAKEAFAQGGKILAGTLLEEQLHHETGAQDTSRYFQNILVNLIITTYEQWTREIL